MAPAAQKAEMMEFVDCGISRFEGSPCLEFDVKGSRGLDSMERLDD